MSYQYQDDYKQHLHSLEGLPLIGTSTLAKTVVDKSQQLLPWAVNTALAYVKEHSEQDEDGDYFVTSATLDIAKKAHNMSRDKSAGKGVDLHALLETFVKECIAAGHIVETDNELVVPFQKWAVDNVEEFYFAEAHCYSKEYLLGGIADVGMLLKDGRRAIGDFKSSKEAYIDHIIQCCLYDIQMRENGVLTDSGKKIMDWDGAHCFIIFPFRSSPFAPEVFENTEQLQKVSLNCVENYKLKLWFDNYKKELYEKIP